MKFRKPVKWDVANQTEGLLFFAQRMDELLFDYTLDSYKPLALNPPYLCKEALLLISDIQSRFIDGDNLSHVLNELEWSIRNDKVAKSLLDAELNKYVLTSDNTSLKDKKIRLEVLSKTLDPHRYLERCYLLLNEAIESTSKKDINLLAQSLVTTLINLEISKQHLQSKTLGYFFKGSIPDIDSTRNISDFLESIFPYSHSFEIYFICSKLIKSIPDSNDAFNLKILKTLPDDLKEISEENDFTAQIDEVYLEIEGIRCGDPHTARELAERRLGGLKDLFTLFNHKNQIDWQEKTLIKQCCVDGPVLVRSPNNSMVKGFDMKPRQASKELNHLIKNFSFKDVNLEKFKRVVDFHGIGVTNDVPENQLLNVWIALETLVPTHSGGSRVCKMIDMILPFLLVNYMSRLVERFSSDLLRWDRHKTRKIFKNIPNTKGMKIYEKALHLLSIKSNGKILDELYTALDDFHLLRFRAYQLSSMFNDPNKIQNTLEQHKTKVTWQIHRIYRTRNLIVHSGRTPKYIHSLIENGHDYLDQVLFEIIKMSSGDYSVETFDQAFELSRLKYSVFSKKLKSIEVFDEGNVSFLLRESWGVVRL